MTKTVKIAIAVVVIVVVVIIVYYLLRPSDAWKVIPNGDINGAQYDIEVSTSGTLDEDKKHALEIGAKSFMRRDGRTFYKNAASPVSTVKIDGQPQTLYVKQ